MAQKKFGISLKNRTEFKMASGGRDPSPAARDSGFQKKPRVGITERNYSFCR